MTNMFEYKLNKAKAIHASAIRFEIISNLNKNTDLLFANPF